MGPILVQLKLIEDTDNEQAFIFNGLYFYK